MSETQGTSRPSKKQATAFVDVAVDPKLAAAVAAWTTQLAAWALWGDQAKTPRWIAMVVALMDDLAAQLDRTDSQPAATAQQAETPTPRSAAGAYGPLVWGVLLDGRVAPAASADQLRAEVATAERGLDELGAARLAVNAADTVAVAQRVGAADDIAHALGVYEQASLTYHLVAGRRPASETDRGASS